MSEDMDIESPEGTKVVFAFPESGWEHDVKQAAKYLKVNEVYTVNYTDIHSWHTDVYLKEFPGIPFNTVQFAEVKTSE